MRILAITDKMLGALLKDDVVIVDGGIITGQGLGATFEFAFELLKVLGKVDLIDQIKKGICYSK